MSRVVLAVALALLAAPVFAQSPPLQSNTPSSGMAVDRLPLSEQQPDTTRSAKARPNARNRPMGQVEAPAKIDTPVQVIAPERKGRRSYRKRRR